MPEIRKNSKKFLNFSKSVDSVRKNFSKEIEILPKIGVKIESAEDLYAAVCESVKNELSEREKPAGDAPMEVEEEKKPEAETSALHIVVRDGLGAAIPFKSAEVAVQSYCMMADNPGSHPFLLLSVGESIKPAAAPSCRQLRRDL